MALTHPIFASFVTEAIERALAGYLRLAEPDDALLAPLRGRVIGLRVRPFDAALYLCPGSSGIQVHTEISGVPDVLLSGSVGALFKVAASGGQVRPGGDEVEIEGDIELAHQVEKLLAEVRIDWSAHLSRLTGSGLAESLGGAVSSSADWLKESSESFKQNLTEFLQEETRDLPARTEVDNFYADVDRLRDDRDRLEARIQRLEKQLGDSAEPRGDEPA